VTVASYLAPTASGTQRIGFLREVLQQWSRYLYKNYTPQSAPLQDLKVNKLVSVMEKIRKEYLASHTNAMKWISYES